MSPEETREQLRDAESLAYQHIRFSGLYKELSGDEWDELAKQWAPVICEKLDQLVDAELTARAAEATPPDVCVAVPLHQFQSMHGTDACWHCDSDMGQHDIV